MLEHEGYISIFPFLFGLVPCESRKIEKFLDLISDPDKVFSE